MGTLLVEVLPLALGAAVSPLLLMASLSLLARPEPLRRAGAYVVGVAITTGVILMAGIVLVEREAGETGPGPLASPWVKLATGVILIGLGILLAVRQHRHDPNAAPRHALVPDDASLVRCLALGLVLMLLNASTLVFLVAILHAMERARAGTTADIAAVAITGFFVLLPALAPWVAAAIGGTHLRNGVVAIGRWLTRNAGYVLGALFLVLGLQDIIQAATGR